jgi:S1/P1 Nuclease
LNLYPGGTLANPVGLEGMQWPLAMGSCARNGSRASTYIVFLTLAALPLPAPAWNIPGHMLSAAIAYQVLQQENSQTIVKVKAVLEKHPWYANQWQARLQDVPVAERDQFLFMRVAKWPDDIRRTDKQYHRGPWHYINWLFKPEGQPASVQIRQPERVNILTAMAENESVVKNENDAERKAIALAWLFHLVGDIVSIA